LTGGRTRAGVPVRAQLMGSDAVCVAEKISLPAALGPACVDLKFGCPAKVVNRNGGGAEHHAGVDQGASRATCSARAPWNAPKPLTAAESSKPTADGV